MSASLKCGQPRCNLRVCASCEWIFKRKSDKYHEGCPKCGFATYGAFRVYGRRAYYFAKTQSPWLDRQMSWYRSKLLSEIRESL